MQTRRRSPRERESTKDVEDAMTVRRLTTLAQDRPRYGCKRLYAVYEREAGYEDLYMNYKRFRRLYRLGNLQISRRRRRSRAKYVRGTPLRRATRPNEIWTINFVSDRLMHMVERFELLRCSMSAAATASPSTQHFRTRASRSFANSRMWRANSAIPRHFESITVLSSSQALWSSGLWKATSS
jgi:hypothetical protein